MEVKPGTKEPGTSYDPETGVLSVRLKSRPEKGKANKELEKLLRKTLGTRTKIVRGMKSRSKLVFAEGLDRKGLEKILNR